MRFLLEMLLLLFLLAFGAGGAIFGVFLHGFFLGSLNQKMILLVVSEILLIEILISMFKDEIPPRPLQLAKCFALGATLSPFMLVARELLGEGGRASAPFTIFFIVGVALMWLGVKSYKPLRPPPHG